MLRQIWFMLLTAQLRLSFQKDDSSANLSDPTLSINTIGFYGSCDSLGDSKIKDGTFEKDCKSCRAMLPGCRRCEKPDPAMDVYLCASCESGMYLMPMEYRSDPVREDYVMPTDYDFYRICVPDCNAVDSNMVNNPSQMRCESLGTYCIYGNYTHGCLQSLGQDEGFTDLRSPSLVGESFPHKEWGQLNSNSGFKVSYITGQFLNLQLYENQFSSIDYCLVHGEEPDEINGNFSFCKLCKPLFYAQNKTLFYNISGVLTSKKVSECVSRCDDGKYPRMLLADQEVIDSTGYDIESAYCTDCSSTCHTCRIPGEEGCVTCRYGFNLEITNENIKTGRCVKIVNETKFSSNKYTIKVTGLRNQTQPLNSFADMLSGLKFAYGLRTKYPSLQTIVVEVNPGVNHYVTYEDLEISGSVIDDQSLLNTSYSLYIQPYSCSLYIDKCSQKARINNKIGSTFQIFIPANGQLTVRNIIFDSLDSVLDCKYLSCQVKYIVRNGTETKNCLSSPTQCCSIGLQSTLFECSYEGTRLQPFFHKFNHCFTKPRGGGLFYMMVYDQKVQYTEAIKSQITIKYCQFNNFYHEMSSLVVLPIDRYQDSQSTNFVTPQYSVVMRDNVFHGFTNCGSLLSNDIELTYLMTPTVNYDLQSVYFQFALRDYFKFNRYYFSSRYAQWLEPPVQSQISQEYSQVFDLQSNQFSNFNFLKRRFTDFSQTRRESSLTRVNSPRLQSLGMIVDIRGSIGDDAPIQVMVFNNQFLNINQVFAKWSIDQKSLDHCSVIDTAGVVRRSMYL